MMRTLFFACLAVSVLAAIAAVAGALVAVLDRRLELNVRYAMGTSVVAVIPGLVFLAHATVYARFRASPAPPPYELWTIAPALLWIIVGPFVFLRSGVLAPPCRAPIHIDALRLCLATGWMALSFMALFAALLI